MTFLKEKKTEKCKCLTNNNYIYDLNKQVLVTPSTEFNKSPSHFCTNYYNYLYGISVLLFDIYYM